jgi:DNA polymerase elongation subunit (family B)
MQELIDKNKALFEESKKELEFKECFRTLIEDKNKVIAARNEEDYKMRTYLSNGMRFFNEEDFKKYSAEENSKKIHELFQKKIEDLNKDSDKRSYEYQSETLKLEIALRKSINKMSDNIESITNNAIERSLSEGNASEEKILLHKIARGSRLKERQDYFNEESQLVSKIKKNLLT